MTINSNGKGKPKALPFWVSFHQQFLYVCYRSLEQKSCKCGKAEFTFRRLLCLLKTKKKKTNSQKNSEVVETPLTKPNFSGLATGALEIKSTITSYVASRKAQRK